MGKNHKVPSPSTTPLEDEDVSQSSIPSSAASSIRLHVGGDGGPPLSPPSHSLPPPPPNGTKLVVVNVDTHHHHHHNHQKNSESPITTTSCVGNKLLGKEFSEEGKEGKPQVTSKHHHHHHHHHTHDGDHEIIPQIVPNDRRQPSITSSASTSTSTSSSSSSSSSTSSSSSLSRRNVQVSGEHLISRRTASTSSSAQYHGDERTPLLSPHPHHHHHHHHHTGRGGLNSQPSSSTSLFTVENCYINYAVSDGIVPDDEGSTSTSTAASGPSSPSSGMASAELKPVGGQNQQNGDEADKDNNSEGESVALKRDLGLVNGISIIVGIIVGSGIFVSPKGVLNDTGSMGLSLIVWISCGLLSTIGALCYAELGCAVPESGGDYAYIRTAFGPLPAFLFLWAATMIIMPAGNAIAALTFANYLLKPLYPLCNPDDNQVRLIAALVICLLTFINCYNVKWATFVQNYFTLAKVIALLVIIVVGFVHVIQGNTENFSEPFKGTADSPMYWAKSFYSGLFSYAGWNYLNFVTEELKSPYKNLPRAILISLPSVTIIYVLANLAYFAVLPLAAIKSSDAVAVDFGSRTLGSFAWIMPVSVALSAFGGLNGGIFASSRLFFVGARKGHLPTALAMVNTTHSTPMPSLLLLGVISLLYLTTTQVYRLIDYCAFIESLFCTFSVAALLWLRHKRPHLHRPIRVNIALPLLFLVVCLFLVLLPIFASPFETGMGVLITLSGIPVYLLTIMWADKPRLYRKLMVKLTHLTQKLTLSVPEAAH